MRARHRRIERIEPVEAREAAEFEIDDARQFQLLRRQRPGAGRVEAPLSKPPPRRRDPIGQRAGGRRASRNAAGRGACPRSRHRRTLTPSRKKLSPQGVTSQARAVLARHAPAGRARPSPRSQARARTGGAARQQGRREQSGHAAARARERLMPPCRRRSARPCAGSAGRRRPARPGRPCRRCRCRRRAPDRCRSSRSWSARRGRCRSGSRP